MIVLRPINIQVQPWIVTLAHGHSMTCQELLQILTSRSGKFKKYVFWENDRMTSLAVSSRLANLFRVFDGKLHQLL